MKDAASGFFFVGGQATADREQRHERYAHRRHVSASLSLSRTLRDKAALIVLDDVWDYQLVQHFPIGGTNCRLLITTGASCSGGRLPTR